MSRSVVEPGRTADTTMRRPSSVVLICTMPDGSEKFDTPVELMTFCPPTARLISLRSSSCPGAAFASPAARIRKKHAPARSSFTFAPFARYGSAREVGSLHSPPARENPSPPLAHSLRLQLTDLLDGVAMTEVGAPLLIEDVAEILLRHVVEGRHIVLRAQRHVDRSALHGEHQELRLLGIDRDGDVVERARPRARRRGRLFVLARAAHLAGR